MREKVFDLLWKSLNKSKNERDYKEGPPLRFVSDITTLLASDDNPWI